MKKAPKTTPENDCLAQFVGQIIYGYACSYIRTGDRIRLANLKCPRKNKRLIKIIKQWADLPPKTNVTIKQVAQLWQQLAPSAIKAGRANANQ